MKIRLIGQNVLIKSSSIFGNKWLETILFFDTSKFYLRKERTSESGSRGKLLRRYFTKLTK